MAADIMILGGVEFTDFSPPEKVPFGGKHAMAVHKLPGGQRVIDMLGPDDMDIPLKGFFFSDDAMGKCMVLDGLRRSGVPVPLIYGGQYSIVVIEEARFNIVRYPHYVEYDITCVVSSSLSGALVSAGIDLMVNLDLGSLL